MPKHIFIQAMVFHPPTKCKLVVEYTTYLGSALKVKVPVEFFKVLLLKAPFHGWFFK